MTAATDRYLIESVSGRKCVDLCELQGDQWITICRDISPRQAADRGFNLDAPAVQRVFESAAV